MPDQEQHTTGRWGWRSRLLLVLATLGSLAVLHWYRDDTGTGRLFRDQTYHHQALRALNHAAAGGADIAEVLAVTRQVRAGDAQGWYAAWTALADRNLARAAATRDRQSRGQALLRAHTYQLRAEFFLPPDDPKRPDSYARSRRAFYDALDTLEVPYERITVAYGSHHLNAVYYPAAAPARAPLVVFCGGVDSTLEELYFFLVAAAHARGYAVLTYEGPGQGAVLREQHLPFTAQWERPTAAVLDAFLATHARPAATVLVGLSLGGYLAARAAAFDDRIDGLVAYDAMFDAGAVVRRRVPDVAFTLRRLGLEPLVDVAAAAKARVDPATAWSLSTGGWVMGKSKPLDVVEAFSAFTLAEVGSRIRQDVLLLAGSDDQFVPIEQIDQVQRALVNARSVTTRIYDEASGGSEHSQLGATTLWQADFFDWLEAKFGT